MRKIVLITGIFLMMTSLSAQEEKFSIQGIVTDQKASFRGLSIVSENVLWVSGSGGTAGRSIDGGKTWTWMKVPGFEKTDFRDIEAFDEHTALIMGIGEPAHILRTTDGGQIWKIVYENKTAGMFLDAMDFRGAEGVVVGDPIDGRLFMAVTLDSGKTWKEVPQNLLPHGTKGEAFFAASGTNVKLVKNALVMVSGGTASNFYFMKKQPNHFPTTITKYQLPVVHGKESTGANSIAIAPNGKKWMVVGGDFANDTSNTAACFYTTNNGKTWTAPEINVHGYRSCVVFISNKELISCGTKGVDYSCDGGKTWTLIATTGYHVCQVAKNGSAVYLAGGNGRIGKLVVE